jgi:hypothetical protein
MLEQNRSQSIRTVANADAYRRYEGLVKQHVSKADRAKTLIAANADHGYWGDAYEIWTVASDLLLYARTAANDVFVDSWQDENLTEYDRELIKNLVKSI